MTDKRNGIIVVLGIALAVAIAAFVGVVGYLVALDDGTQEAKGTIPLVNDIEKEEEQESSPAEEDVDFYDLHVGDYYDSGNYLIITKDDPLNMREFPGQAATKVGQIPRGTMVNVTGTSGNWGYTTYDGHGGWINLDYAVPEWLNFVWVTFSGDCYHLPFCHTIRDHDPIQVEIAVARDTLGRRPCQTCVKPFYPDE